MHESRVPIELPLRFLQEIGVRWFFIIRMKGRMAVDRVGTFLVATLVILCLNGTVHADLTSGLVAHYGFNGDATDSAGDNDGTEYGGVTYAAQWGTFVPSVHSGPAQALRMTGVERRLDKGRFIV